MKNLPWLQKIIIPMVALVIGLIIGFGVSHIQIKKDQKIFQEKIKEANRKVAFIEKKAREEKTETAVSSEQTCQGDKGKLDKLENEKKALTGQVAKLKEQTQNLGMKAREADEASAMAKKLEIKVRESDEASAKSKKELQEMERNSKDLDRELKKIRGEKQTIQAELKKKTEDLGHCAANNAELCIIAEELVEKYRNKGLGSMLLAKEPLTQIKKVELEQFTQKYQEEIRQHKTNKK